MKTTLVLPILFACAIASPAVSVQAQTSGAPIGVVVNGARVSLDQPPVAQAGRLFVPLRGIFERLGASVVFQNGQINATAGSTTVALHIGQPVAYVNGQQRTLESPPFLVAGRALVPLRFIAETLGARVSFESTGPYGRAVIVDASGAAPIAAAPPNAATAPEPPTSHQNLVRVEPAIDATVAGVRPEISSSFALPTDPDTVKMFVDGRNVTSDAYVNDRNLVFHPLFDLPPGRHVVRVTGRTVAPKAPFDERWAFAVEPSRGDNFVRDVQPENGAHVGSSFDVRGFTTPAARVHLVATASARSIGFNESNEDQATADGTANEDGYFRIHLDVADHGAGVVDVRMTSTTTDGTVTVQTLRLRP